MKKKIVLAAGAAGLVYFVVAILPGDGPTASGQLSAALSAVSDDSAAPEPADETKYLTFQVFTDESPKLWSAPTEFAGLEPSEMRYVLISRAEMARTVQDIVDRIATKGSSERRLGFVIGPIAIDYRDDQLRGLIADAFEVATDKGVAVGFHIDDSMFWFRRRDLWSDIRNVEWLDWNKTANTGRRLDWGDPPEKLAPQMCYNAEDIESEIGRIARDVIGRAIKQGVDALESSGRGELFAGVIVGWETQLAKDFETDRALGYCALTNAGFSADNPPPDMDLAREAIVREFIELWSFHVGEAGIDRDKIYSHTAFQSTKEYREVVSNDPTRQFSYSEMNNFAPPRVAFGEYHNPGFSTYPAPGLYEDLYQELARHPGARWASAEGTNVRTGMRSGEDTMETYLARHFNHGATLVNVFAWGVGGENDPWRSATESSEAIAAYRKFLNGSPLEASPIPDDYGLPAKVKRIQRELPEWVRAGGDGGEAERLLKEMWSFIEKKEPWKAEEVADRILEMIER